MRCATRKRMSRPRSHRPSRTVTNGGSFNERLFVDLCDVVDVRGNRSGWLGTVVQHSDYLVITPCPLHEGQAAAEKWQAGQFCNIKCWMSVVGYEIVHALNQEAGGCAFLQQYECMVSK